MFFSSAATVLSSDLYNGNDYVHSDGVSDSPYGMSYQQCILGNELNTKCMGSVFRFSANLRHISSKCVESPIVTLNDLLWKIKFCYNNNKIVASLDSSLNSRTSNWTSDAKATIKLLPYGEHDRIFVKQLTSHRFSASSSSSGVEVINWSDYVNNWMNDDYDANFEIEITTNPVKPKSSLSMNQISAKLQVLLDNVSTLSQRDSSMVILQGVRWRVKIQRQHDILSLHLLAEDDNDFHMGSSYKADVIIKMLSFNITSKPLTRSFTHNYCWGNTEHGIDLMHWSTFTDRQSKYVLQDKARILVQIKVADPQLSLWDVNGTDLFDADAPQRCSNCNRVFGDGVVYSNCGHLYCKQCYDSNPSIKCSANH